MPRNSCRDQLTPEQTWRSIPGDKPWDGIEKPLKSQCSGLQPQSSLRKIQQLRDLIDHR
ncbi:MAG: hypothetical protein AB8B70_07330 [Prochlorococcus sp.]